MTEGKYVVTAAGKVKVFERSAIHAYQVCTCPQEDCEGRAVSAGFFEVKDGVVRAYGESTSLGVRSREEDTALVEKELTRLHEN